MMENNLYTADTWVFPFDKVEKDSKIVVWGLSYVGRIYYEQVKNSIYSNNIIFVDNAWKKLNIKGVLSPKEIMRIKADVVVLALVKNDSIKEVQNELKQMGYDGRVVRAKKNRVPVFDINIALHSKVLDAQEAIIQYGYPVIESWKSFRRLLHIYRVVNHDLIRIGSNNDGGYIMVDDFNKGGIAYSFGVDRNVDWDRQMVERGYDVWMYDHTIKELPENQEGFHFFRKGIADSPFHNDDLMSLNEILLENDHTNCSHMVLKMDVEGAEWGFFHMTNSSLLEKFDQIVIEAHDLLLHGGLDVSLKQKYIDKVLKTHSLIHVHPNNFGEVVYVDGVPYPGTLELTFVNNRTYKLEDAGEITLPIDLDAPCGNHEDIRLGKWNI